MRFTVTPLGGAGSDVGRVVDGIVRDMHPARLAGRTADGPARDGIEGPSRSYADRGEEPGRWLGHAARAADLPGEVQRDDFCCSGRSGPRTDERLITAQGSAGGRPKLGAGTSTRSSLGGDVLDGDADATAVLVVTKAEAARMFDVGTPIALDPDGEGRASGRAKGRANGRVSAFG